MGDKNDYVHCSRCGKQVSNRVGRELVVRAWVECPECIGGSTGEEVHTGAKGYRTYSWGNYIFNFPVGEDGVLLEVAMRMEPDIEYIPHIPILRPGIILTDDKGGKWQVAYTELVNIPPCRLKGSGRFEPPSGLYSPQGWIMFKYKIEAVG